LRYWQGLPYRSKQVEFLRLTKNDGIGLQRLTNFKNCVYAEIENKKIDWQDIATNDGLTFLRFDKWFENADNNDKAIIQFTNFRY